MKPELWALISLVATALVLGYIIHKGKGINNGPYGKEDE